MSNEEDDDDYDRWVAALRANLAAPEMDKEFFNNQCKSQFESLIGERKNGWIRLYRSLIRQLNHRDSIELIRVWLMIYDQTSCAHESGVGDTQKSSLPFDIGQLIEMFQLELTENAKMAAIEMCDRNICVMFLIALKKILSTEHAVYEKDNSIRAIIARSFIPRYLTDCLQTFSCALYAIECVELLSEFRLIDDDDDDDDDDLKMIAKDTITYCLTYWTNVGRRIAISSIFVSDTSRRIFNLALTAESALEVRFRKSNLPIISVMLDYPRCSVPLVPVMTCNRKRSKSRSRRRRGSLSSPPPPRANRKLKISLDGCCAWATATRQTVQALHCADRHSFYFEVLLLTDGPIRIGWSAKSLLDDEHRHLYPHYHYQNQHRKDKIDAEVEYDDDDDDDDDNFDRFGLPLYERNQLCEFAIGSDANSIAFNAYTGQVWHENQAIQLREIGQSHAGDVIGTVADFYHVTFYLNGTPVYRHAHSNGSKPMFAAATIYEAQRCYFNFGQIPFKYHHQQHHHREAVNDNFDKIVDLESVAENRNHHHHHHHRANDQLIAHRTFFDDHQKLIDQTVSRLLHQIFYRNISDRSVWRRIEIEIRARFDQLILRGGEPDRRIGILRFAQSLAESPMFDAMQANVDVICAIIGLYLEHHSSTPPSQPQSPSSSSSSSSSQLFDSIFDSQFYNQFLALITSLVSFGFDRQNRFDHHHHHHHHSDYHREIKLPAMFAIYILTQKFAQNLCDDDQRAARIIAQIITVILRTLDECDNLRTLLYGILSLENIRHVERWLELKEKLYLIYKLKSFARYASTCTFIRYSVFDFDPPRYQLAFCAQHLLDRLTAAEQQIPFLLPLNQDDKIRNQNGEQAIYTMEDNYSLEKVKFSQNQLSARCGAASRTIRSCFRSTDSNGIYYYEVCLITGGSARIGWIIGSSADDEQDSDERAKIIIGNDSKSIAFDGFYRWIWYRGVPPSPPPLRQKIEIEKEQNEIEQNEISHWQAGDIVGCMLDCAKRKFRFFVNGHEVMRRTISKNENNANNSDCYYHAAISLRAHQHVYCNFGQVAFKYLSQICASSDSMPEIQSFYPPSRRIEASCIPYCDRCKISKATFRHIDCTHHMLCADCASGVNHCPDCVERRYTLNE